MHMSGSCGCTCVCVCVCVCVWCTCACGLEAGGTQQAVPFPIFHCNLPALPSMARIIGPKASQARRKMSTGLGNENSANTIPSTWK